MSQDTLLDIFSMGVEDTAPIKEKEKTEVKQAAAIKREVKKPEPVLVHGDWQIHFATESFTVSDFVNEIPENGVSLEEVREGIERHFPKFSAARTKWDVDAENKRLFPDAFAGSKGALQLQEGRFAPSFFYSVEEAIQSSQVNCFVISKDLTLYAVNHSTLGVMISAYDQLPNDQFEAVLSKLDSTRFPQITDSFSWTLPKIPNRILQQIVGFFRAYVTEEAQYEVTVRVYWDMETQSFIVDCPEQIVTPVFISFNQMEEYSGRNAMRYIPVLEVHSHNVMRAFFSPTDDANEQSFHTSFGVFGVIGRLNRAEHEMVFRAKFNQTSIELSADTIFDLHSLNDDYSFPLEWHKRVETRKEFYL